jgi:hypothetical protein
MCIGYWWECVVVPCFPPYVDGEIMRFVPSRIGRVRIVSYKIMS